MRNARLPNTTWPLLLSAAGLTLAGWYLRSRDQARTRAVDETTDLALEDSFPASDPPSWGSASATAFGD